MRMSAMEGSKALTVPIYDVPRSTQETIPIYQIAEDGIFCLEKKPKGENKQFDKAYLFLDTNYALKDEMEKEEFLKKYCQLLNSMNVSFKICIMNNNRNMQQLRNEVFLRCAHTEPAKGRMAKEINALIQDAVSKGLRGIRQAKLFIITCEAQTAEHARSYFRTIEGSLLMNFRRLESTLLPLNAQERLKYLHYFYCLGKEEEFQFRFSDALKKGADWRNSICSLSIRHHKDEHGTYDGQTLEYDNRFVRTLFVREYPSSIDDEFVKMVSNVPYHIILTLDVAPVPDHVSRKRLLDKYMATGTSINKAIERQNRMGLYTAEVPYPLTNQQKEIKDSLDIMDNDERVFLMGFYITVTASSMEKLEEYVLDLKTRAANYSFVLEPAMWNQMEALNTALPVGARFCRHMRTVFTLPLSTFVPFNVAELSDKDGIFYGTNEISKNIVIGDRKALLNPHGFVLAASGAGKGFEVKTEMTQVILKGEDDVIVIDPQNEYAPLAHALGGQYIDVSPLSGDHINPLDLDTLNFYKSRESFIADKSELMLAIAEQILEENVLIGQKSIVARCTAKVYEEYFRKADSNRREPVSPPTMEDFYRILMEQTEPEARDLKLAFELFADGPLDFLTKQSNVDTKSHFLVYGTNNLGKNQEAVAQTVMLEGIRSRVAANYQKGVATWIYIDEIHNMTATASSARYLQKIWKEFRKIGGINTGITQNITDLLESKEARTMLNNSKFFVLLNMEEDEARLLTEVLGLNDELTELLKGADKGHGVMKFGDKKYIPKNNNIPENTLLYDLFDTDFHGKQKRWKKGDLRKELSEAPDKAQAAALQEVAAAGRSRDA